jgi:hypothetical protein
MPLKNSSEVIGNRTCDLPVCSAVSQSIGGTPLQVSIYLCGAILCTYIRVYYSIMGTCLYFLFNEQVCKFYLLCAYLAVPFFCNYLVEGVIFGKISLILNACSGILYKF